MDHLIRQLSGPQWIWGVLWIGLGLLTVALVVLMQTRWGQSQPLRKCIVLSVWAHVLLAAYATTVQIVTPLPGDADNATLRISTVEGALAREWDDADLPPAQPWEHAADAVASAGEWQQPEPAEQLVLDMPEARLESSVEPLLQTSLAAEVPDQPFGTPDVVVPASEIEPLARTAPTPTEPIAAPVAQKVERQDLQPAPSLVSEPVPTLEATPPMPPTLASDNLADALLGPPSPLPEMSDAVLAPEAQPALPGIDDLVGRASTPVAPEHVTVEPAMVPVPAPAASVEDLVEVRSPLPMLDSIPAAALNQPPQLAPPPAALAGLVPGLPTPAPYRGRMAADKADALQRHGGTAQTEAAVQSALAWLAANQSADGRWDPRAHGAGRELRVLGHDRGGAGARADTGVTGLAILAFLGAGHTHQRGDFVVTLDRALNYLARVQGADGNLGGQAETFAFMYCHGMATLALGEAYGMTGDPRLEQPLRRAIGYTLAAQHRSNGGWRYRPGDLGDTSQFGWQWMALRSAELAGIDIPPAASDAARRYLSAVAAGVNGGLASYRPGEGVSRPMTAEALVCRQLMGLPANHPAAIEGGNYLLGELPGAGRANLYYWYYGTLAMFQLQGHHWQRWNQALTETLVASQRLDGPLAGSWDPTDIWGGYGGRVYSTALAALSLEVYYRYLPLYELANEKAGAWR